MAESQIVIRVDRDTLRVFRAECMRRGTTPTKELARLLERRVAEWEGEAHRLYGLKKEDVHDL